MADWTIKFEGEEDDSEEDESQEELAEESEPLEDIITDNLQSPTATTRFNREEVNPFLEAEPVENLEEDLELTPTNGNKEGEEQQNLEEPMLYNAPQYSGSYDSGNYENTRATEDKEVDTTGGALMARETTIQSAQNRRMDMNAWQQQNVEQFDSQSEKYQLGKAQKLKEPGDLPFQGEDKVRGFG